MNKKQVRHISMALSFVYVFAGTVGALMFSPEYEEVFRFNRMHPLWDCITTITFPVVIIVIALMFLDSSIVIIFIVDCFVFYILQRLLYYIILFLDVLYKKIVLLFKASEKKDK